MNLNHNKIEKLLNNNFEGLDKLTSISFDYNKIQEIEVEAFSGLEGKISYLLQPFFSVCSFFSEQLTYMSLAANKISWVPTAALANFHQMNTLHLNDNDISR